MKYLFLLCSLCVMNISNVIFSMESSSNEEVENRAGKIIERKLSKRVKSGDPAQIVKLLQQIAPEQRNLILSGASRTNLSQKTLLDAAMERLAEAEKQEQSTITSDRVKASLISIGIGGVGVYTMITTFWPSLGSSNVSSGNQTDASASDDSINLNTAVTNFIGSLYLIFASGKGLWKVGKNHFALRKKEKAHTILHLLQQSQTPPNTPTAPHKPMPIGQTGYAIQRLSLQNQADLRANKKTITELEEKLTQLTQMIDSQKQRGINDNTQKLEYDRKTLTHLLNITTLERQKRKQKRIAEIPVEEEEHSFSQLSHETKHYNSPTSSSDYSESKKIRQRKSPRVSSSPHSSDDADDEE